MKKEVIIVPKDKCPLDVLAEMQDRTKNSWIFLHRNTADKLMRSEGVEYHEGKDGYYVLTWEATEKYPETQMVINYGVIPDWKPISSIYASDIAYRHMSADPEDIFFLKMEE